MGLSLIGSALCASWASRKPMLRARKHPRITMERWKEILKQQRQKQGRWTKKQAARRIAKLSQASLARARASLPSHCVPFLWPTPKYAKPPKKQAAHPMSSDRCINRCRFESWVNCRRCGTPVKDRFKHHIGTACPPPRPQHVVERQVARTQQLREWLGDAKVPGMTAAQVQATFDSANPRAS